MAKFAITSFLLLGLACLQSAQAYTPYDEDQMTKAHLLNLENPKDYGELTNMYNLALHKLLGQDGQQKLSDKDAVRANLYVVFRRDQKPEKDMSGTAWAERLVTLGVDKGITDQFVKDAGITAQPIGTVNTDKFINEMNQKPIFTRVTPNLKHLTPI